MTRVILSLLLRGLGSLLLLALALYVLDRLWVRYQVEPITRDAKVRADIVDITPDVSGWVTEVHFQDNQPVHRGQLLLVLDRPRFQLAYDQALAALRYQQATLAQALREDRRNHAMPDLVATETTERGHELVQQLQAAVAQATARLGVARLNLERSRVYAPMDGVVSNITLQPGDYATAGKPVAALVYTASLRVEAYFEETKLPAVHVNDPATIQLMGQADLIQGHVQSIAPGIIDRERDKDGNVSSLANINPSFTWVRLAQRIPVRIVIDRLPPGTRLVAGQTATVRIRPRPGDDTVPRSLPW